MNKYFRIITITWAEMLEYRLNFVLWRVRMVMQLLISYFLWQAIFLGKASLFGYTQASMLQYILLGSIVRTVSLGTTVYELGNIIHQGNLSNILIKPLDVFRSYIARDAADKVLNLGFAVVELSILIVILRPTMSLQPDAWMVMASVVALLMGTVLYFLMSLLIGFIGFWAADVWAPRFLLWVFLDFFSGGLFPLDILPKPLYVLSQLLPFGYFNYFPVNIYLGQLPTSALIQGFGLLILWIILLWFIAHSVWRAGLRVYTAVGR